MNAPLRRNACPTLAAPMPTGDGLLARLNFVSGAISPDNLALLARLSERHGNGLLEVTRRGSLQVRGLSAVGAERFAADIGGTDLDLRTGVAIDVSALSGLDVSCTGDPRGMAAAMRGALDERGLTARLGPKVSVVIDGGGQLSMDEVLADVRLKVVRVNAAALWHVEVLRRTGGPAISLAEKPDEAIDKALLLLAAIADAGPLARARDLTDDAVRRLLGDLLVNRYATPAPQPLGVFALTDNRAAVGIALPFGQAAAPVVRALAETARSAGVREFRFAPGSALLAICDSRNAADIRANARALGLVVDPEDPRRRIVACAGAPACASGYLDTKAIAAALAKAPALLPTSAPLHISGCAKKCAQPARFAFALVGTPDGAVVEDPDDAGAGLAVARGEVLAGFERFLRARSGDAGGMNTFDMAGTGA